MKSPDYLDSNWICFLLTFCLNETDDFPKGCFQSSPDVISPRLVMLRILHG